MSLLDRYRQSGDLRPPRPTVALVPKKRVSLHERLSSGEVEWSEDFERVKNLPRRPRPDDWPAWADELERIGHPLAPQIRRGVPALVQELTEKLKRPEGTQTLREVQALTLWEASIVGGVIGMIRTGGGKSLIGMLLPMLIAECKRAVLLLPADLRPQFHADWKTYGQHWVLPNLAGGDGFVVGRPVLHVVTYHDLQQPKSSALLDQINPDLLMADEMSALKNFSTSARGKRFIRRFADSPNTRFAGWDATPIANSVAEFWHLLFAALSEGSPLPTELSEVKRWAKALDPSDSEGYFLPGVLQQFCEPGESVRSGFQRRLVATPGIIVTEENVLTIPLIFQERKPPPIPENIAAHLRTLRRRTQDGGWKRPDGEELKTAVEVVACAKQLAEGCWFFWRFPRGEPREVIELWFERRQAWNRELRAVLQSSRVHMDSDKLCENAAYRYYAGGCPGCARGAEQDHEAKCRVVETHPLWDSQTYLPWIEVEDTVHHVTAVQWESDWLLEDAAAWAREAPGIVWVDHPEFGHRLSQMTGLAYYGGGDGHQEILTADESKSIICSVRANKKGKNLQAWNRMLIVGFPSSNAEVEQAVGRCYREGQKAEQVECFYYKHTPELEHCFDTAIGRAHFIAETMGSAQKLVYGKFLGAAC